MRLAPALRPDPLNLRRLDPSVRRRQEAMLALLFVGLAVAVIPDRWLTWAGVTMIDDEPFAPFLVGLSAYVLIAVGTRALWRGARTGAVGRPLCFALGLVIAALSGNGARSTLELAGLRQLWRPELVLAEPIRILPTLWMWLAAAVEIGGFLVGLAAMGSALVPRRSSSVDVDRHPLFWRVGGWASWIPTAHLGLFVVGSWVLGPSLMRSLDSLVPTAEGRLSGVSTQSIFMGMWTGISSLSVLQLVLGFWSAVELARLVHDVAPRSLPQRSPRTAMLVFGSTALVALGAAIVLGRADLWPGASVDTSDARAALGSVIDRWGELTNALPLQILAALVIGVCVTTLVVVAGQLGVDDGRGDSDEDPLMKRIGSIKPEVWAVLPLGIVLLFGVVVGFSWTFGEAISAPLRFPSDAAGFFGYWEMSHLVPEYAAIDAPSVVGPGLGVVLAVGMFACIFEGSRSAGIAASVLAVGTLALLPSLGDLRVLLLLYPAFLLGTVFAFVVVEERSDWEPAALRVAMVCGVLVAYALTPNAPVAVLMAGTVLLRLAWQAGALNDTDARQQDRLDVVVGSMLMLGGIVVAQEASWFDGATALASIGQTVALPLVGVPLVVGLYAWEARGSGP